MTGVFDDHLTLDAVVAYADGEMSLTAYQRAAAHLARCIACAADVAEQTAASQYLRTAWVPAMPGSLFDSLKSIPIAAPVAPHPEGGAHGIGRRFRLGAGALVAGIAVGAVVVTSAGDTPPNPVGPRAPNRTAVSDRSVPAQGGMTRTTVVNVLGHISGITH